MKPKYYYDKRTTNAWETLHSRLDKDGLLDNAKRGERMRFRYTALGWAASLVIVATAALFAVKSFKTAEPAMLTITNNESSSVYVTTLKDGSVVYLSKDASLTYPRRFNGKKREVSLKGDAYFQIFRNEKAPFVVQTDLIEVEVLGTSFRVSSEETLQPSLSVQSGLVKVTLKSNGQTANTSAGETVLIKSGNLEKSLTRDLGQFRRYGEKMHFKDERLEDVVGIINRNISGADIEIEPELRERLLTATFADNSPESMAKLISLALNVSYSSEAGKIRIFEP
jgi:ferric-dicitrate binding protein FerR (iron transport regulator)